LRSVPGQDLRHLHKRSTGREQLRQIERPRLYSARAKRPRETDDADTILIDAGYCLRRATIVPISACAWGRVTLRRRPKTMTE
jgi:hypothetical protein